MSDLESIGIFILPPLAILLIAISMAVFMYRKRPNAEIAGITDTQEFAEGYELCIDVCKEIDGLHSARDAAESYQKEDFTAHRYGFVCAYCDITNSPKPAPWGKA